MWVWGRERCLSRPAQGQSRSGLPSSLSLLQKNHPSSPVTCTSLLSFPLETLQQQGVRDATRVDLEVSTPHSTQRSCTHILESEIQIKSNTRDGLVRQDVHKCHVIFVSGRSVSRWSSHTASRMATTITCLVLVNPQWNH